MNNEGGKKKKKKKQQASFVPSPGCRPRHSAEPPLEGWPWRGPRLLCFPTASAWRRWGTPAPRMCDGCRAHLSEEQTGFDPSWSDRNTFGEAGVGALVSAGFQTFVSSIYCNLCLARSITKGTFSALTGRFQGALWIVDDPLSKSFCLLQGPAPRPGWHAGEGRW